MCPETALSHEELVALVLELRAEVTALREENARLRDELAKKGGPPSWAKPKTPPRPPKARKRRGKGFGRACVAEPDAIVEHVVDVCPDCGHALTGGWTYSSHEVIDLPVQPAIVTRHVRLMRQCGVCGRRVAPTRASLQDGSVGRHRFSARVMSLVSYWHHRCRLPLRLIQQTLRALTGGLLHVSVGEVRAMLDTVAARGQPSYAALQTELRGSAVVQADETSWREDGQHGYVWAFLTPTVRYFERHATRSGQVPKEVLGEEFTGIVVSDGYKGYDPLPCWKQRCWVHLLRHAHRLRTIVPEVAEAQAWVDGLTAIYQDATALVAAPGYAHLAESVREAHRLAFEARVQAHATPHRQETLKEWANLATYLTDYLNELFVFMQHPAVPSHNNAAEQAVRGPVTARKICGGTRSAQGSKTKMVLFSLLETCVVRGLDPVTAMEGMLRGQPLFAPRTL
jgi:transposase